MFVIALVALSAIAWVGWSLLNHRSILVSNLVVSDNQVSVGTLTAPDSLDIRNEQGNAVTQALLGNVYQTLLSKSNSNVPQAGIAQSWEVSKDALHYTFHLNSNARFSNGHKLDAQDVVWSLQQTITKKYQGSADLSSISAVNEDDANTISITVASPSPNLLRSLCGRAGIIYDQEAKINYSTQAVGSGPYTVASWDKGSSLKLTRNNDYWGAAPKTAQMTLKYYTDSKHLSAALASGDVDIATPLDATGLQTAKSNTSLTVSKGVSQDSVVLAFNTDTSSVLSDQRLRQAIRYLIDDSSIVGSQQGLGAAIAGPFSPLDAGYEDLTGMFPLDINKGAALAAYFPPSYYGGSLRLVYPESYGAQLGELIKTQLAKGGIPVTVTLVNDATWKQQVESQRAFDMTVITTSSDADSGSYADPSKSITKFDSPSAQDHYHKAQAATSEENYTKELKAYARAVSDGAPADWLFMKVPVTAYSKSLTGVPVNMTDSYLPLWNVSEK
jgi:peptide/nickel transport system substrate-binding protein